MLSRDVNVDSFIRQYYPKAEIRNFEKDMFNVEKNNLHTVAFEEKDVRSMVENNNFYLYVQGGTIVTSFLGGVVFYNKLPFFKNIQGKWKRFFSKVFLFLTPIYLASGYSIYKSATDVEKYYQKYFDQYCKYKCTGDLRDINPDIKCKI